MLDLLATQGAVESHYPLHDPKTLNALYTEWVTFRLCGSGSGSGPSNAAPPAGEYRLCSPKLARLKDYFGEKIAIYFLFVHHFTVTMFPAAVFGVVTHFHRVWGEHRDAEGNVVDVAEMPIYAMTSGE